MKADPEIISIKPPEILPNTPENRTLTAKRVITFLKKSGIWALSRDPSKRDKLIQKTLDPQIAEDFLERLNGIIVGTPIHQREMYEHARVIANTETGEVAHVSSDPVFQKQIFKKIIVPTVKKLNTTDASEFASASINLLHAFHDGNGRLARTVYFLMNPDLAKLDEEQATKSLEGALSHHKSGINFNPGVIYGYLDKIILCESSSKDESIFDVTAIENFERIKADSELLEERADSEDAMGYAIARTIMEDQITAFMACREYIFKKPREERGKYLKENRDKKQILIDADVFMEDMTDDDNVNRWMGCYEIVKMWRFQHLANIFLEPDFYPRIKDGLTIKEYFESEVFAHYKEQAKNEKLFLSQVGY